MTALFPTSPNAERLSIQCQQLHQRQFFLSLAWQNCTCLIEVSSDSRRVRASLLIVDGKVAGAIFGRRSIANKVYGRNAYLETLIELGNPETVLTVQTVSNKIALSIASVFAGQKPYYSVDLNSALTLEQTKRQIAASKAFGCAFLSDETDVPHTIVYFAEGKFFCAYSAKNKTFDPIENDAIALDDTARIKQIRMMLTPMQPVLIEGQVQLADLEEHMFTANMHSQNSPLPIELLKQHSERSELITALKKNKASHEDQYSAAMRTVQGMAARRASRDHAHRVNPFS
jgi:hypothetical protein